MQNLPRGILIYLSVVVGLGVVCLVQQTANFPLSDLGQAVFWAILLVLATLSPITLPRGGATITPSSAVTFGGLVVFGPAVASWFAVFNALVSDGVVRRAPVHKVVFNASQLVITVVIASWVYWNLGGRWGVGPHNSVDALGVADLGRILVSGVVYFLVNTTLVSGVIGIGEGISPRRVWQVNYLPTAPLFLAVLPVGILMAVMHIRVGMLPVALLFIPLLIARYCFKQYMDIREAHLEIIRALTSAIDAVDPYTEGHSQEVSRMAVEVGRKLGMRESQVEELECAALLHDIGKIVIQSDILCKEAPLTPEEMDIVRNHPHVGAELVGKLKSLYKVADIVAAHHERPDGRGYPYGRRNSEIPLAARIIHAVDAYHAMRSDRPYRTKRTKTYALRELLEGAGTDFDPRVVGAIEYLCSNGSFDAAEGWVPLEGKAAQSISSLTG
ncbi:MAG: HD-GYP domain-containing protein [Candidatus Eisenbacteria sp.]|nr:HD-GYP domain-containing protein [Candidatus Eisenbacteria bacterium]